MKLYILYESAAGLSLFKRKKFKKSMTVDDIIVLLAEKEKFMKKFKLVAFSPFLDSSTALTNLQQINDGKVTPLLESFLTQNLPVGKSFGLAVQDRILGQTLSTNYGYVCKNDKVIFEIFRSIRSLFSDYIDKKNFNLQRLLAA